MLNPISAFSSWLDKTPIDSPFFKVTAWVPLVSSCIEMWKVQLLFKKAKAWHEASTLAQGDANKLFLMKNALGFCTNISNFMLDTVMAHPLLKLASRVALFLPLILCCPTVGIGVLVASTVAFGMELFHSEHIRKQTLPYASEASSLCASSRTGQEYVVLQSRMNH